MLLNLYTMATTTSLQSRIITAIKLKRVRMWGEPNALAGAPSSIVLEWVGTQAPSTLHSDTAIGIRPAFIQAKPPSDGSERWWSISGNNETEILMKLSSIGTGVVVDVQAEIRFADDEAAVAGEAGTPVSSSLGKVYYNYLDGFASKLLAPMGGVSVLP